MSFDVVALGHRNQRTKATVLEHREIGTQKVINGLGPKIYVVGQDTQSHGGKSREAKQEGFRTLKSLIFVTIK